MITKNTYGLSVLLSGKTVAQIKHPIRFSGSSLNRLKKEKPCSLKTIREEILKEEEARNFASLIEVYNQVKHLTSDNYYQNDDILQTSEYITEEQEISFSDTFYNALMEVRNGLEIPETDSLLYSDNNHNFIQEKQQAKLKSMSARTKQKIRKKVIAFSQVYLKLTFITLTFVNQVSDSLAVNILRRFLDNCSKRLKGFEYIWVAERQTKNTVFTGNIHFHLITNKYLKVDKYWAYWVTLQEKHGILPRNKDFKPSSAFDIKRLNANNIKAIGQYITKYVTKNVDSFDCQVWNCSKGVSKLYTDFYAEYSFIEKVEKLLEVDLDPIYTDYCTLYQIPLNRKTLPLYERLSNKNRNLFDKNPQQ
jgi:hypothetical protein